MQFFRTAAVSGLVALITAATASAEDFAVPIDLGRKASIDLTIERSRKNSENPMVEAMGSIAFHYRQDFEANEEGYRVTQKFLKADSRNGLELPPAALEAIKIVTFDVGEDLAPLRLHDLGPFLESMRPALSSSGAVDSAAFEKALDLFRSMSPEEAATAFLQEQSFVSLPQAVALNLGDPLEEVIEEELPDGKIAQTTQRLELTRIDKRGGVAFVEFISIPNATALMASVGQVAERLGVADQLPKAETPEQISRSTKCSYEVDLKTGLTRRADCAIHISVTEGGKTMTREDHWVITQALVKR